MGNLTTCRVVMVASVTVLSVLLSRWAVDTLAEEDDDANCGEHGQGSAKENDGTTDRVIFGLNRYNVV